MTDANNPDPPLKPGDLISYEGKDGVYLSDAPPKPFRDLGLGYSEAAIIKIDGQQLTVPRPKVKRRWK